MAIPADRSSRNTDGQGAAPATRFAGTAPAELVGADDALEAVPTVAVMLLPLPSGPELPKPWRASSELREGRLVFFLGELR